MGLSENVGILPDGYFARLMRVAALAEYAVRMDAQAAETPPGQSRDEMVVEAAAARARAVEIVQATP